jgi:lipopolysaccharide export system protein LptC
MLDAATVAGRIELPAGTVADMTAPAAEIDTGGDHARFLGGVTSWRRTGTGSTPRRCRPRLARRTFWPDSEVRIIGPHGTLEAGEMRITQDDAGGYVAVFKGSVRLVYDPGKRQE